MWYNELAHALSIDLVTYTSLQRITLHIVTPFSTLNDGSIDELDANRPASLAGLARGIDIIC